MVNCFYYILSESIFDVVHRRQTCWQGMWRGTAMQATSTLLC